MIISLTRPNTVSNIKFLSNRNFDNRQKAIDKYFDMIEGASDGDCFCRNKKDCVSCSRKRNDFLQEKGLDILDADEMEFIKQNPNLASIIDFDYNSIITSLIKKGYSTTGAHSIIYTHDQDGNFLADVRVTDENDDDIHYIYSKEGFIAFMDKIKNIKQHLGHDIHNKLNLSFELLKSDIAGLELDI